MQIIRSLELLRDRACCQSFHTDVTNFLPLAGAKDETRLPFSYKIPSQKCHTPYQSDSLVPQNTNNSTEVITVLA